MTALPKAYKALDDFRLALRVLEDEDRPEVRRVLYFGIILLLRTIGDLLSKHGSESEKKKFAHLRRLWDELPAGESVYKFLVDERNFLAHEYVPSHSDEQPQFLSVIENDVVIELSVEVSTDLYWPVQRPPFEGEDARDVVARCIDWWDSQLKLF